ncbi:unnamed protein product [Thelazia callipaeda]|uniref:Uncharacterized protein n=1 Tax=Thelazia callipaeda TaxID=103827 RepID=A0A0N5CVB7_THECL|nr:unnamed protein product [Thelazia callipaeda]
MQRSASAMMRLGVYPGAGSCLVRGKHPYPDLMTAKGTLWGPWKGWRRAERYIIYLLSKHHGSEWVVRCGGEK